MTKWLVANTQSVAGGKIEYKIPESPLIHVCCNKDQFGDLRVDFDPVNNPDLVADVTTDEFVEGCEELLPYAGACFADFPWVESWRWKVKPAVRNMLKVAPVAYVIAPWLYGWKGLKLEGVHVSWRPGINHPILFAKYVRSDCFWDVVDE